jgi:bifunctional DNA-binding transcriptional regulator/antitoxin component of YhaV-PrlF toxin-antitoxin module
MTIRAIQHSKITLTKTISFSKEIADMLKVNIGDEILYILNKNGVVIIRKFEGDVILGPGERYLSSCTVYRKGVSFSVYIARDIMQINNVDIGYDVIFIVDSDINIRDINIIIRNAFLSNTCSIDMLNKDISALIIDITTLQSNNQTTLPKNVRDILGVDEGDIFALSIDEFNNVIIHRGVSKNLKPTAMYCLQEAKLGARTLFTISNEVRNILNITTGDKILWIVDEDGNIIIRNTILPDSCMLS